MIEGLAPARMLRVERCIAGKCGREHNREVSTICRGGCGRFLHVVECAGLSPGYAALGNFTCPACRVARMTSSDGDPSDAALALASRTMMLELAQGAESTGASYATPTQDHSNHGRL